MSIGVNIMLHLIKETMSHTPEHWNIDIAETHHIHKKDTPSGTAKKMLQTVMNTIGDDQYPVTHNNKISVKRDPSDTSIHVTAHRDSDVVGEHKITFASNDECISISHSAHNRKIFASGALQAALWLHNRIPGFYTMNDVLFSKSK